MINAVVYKSGILRKSWRFKFVGDNNAKFGHQYNDREAAVDAVRKLMSPNMGVWLIIDNGDGTETDKGRIR